MSSFLLSDFGSYYVGGHTHSVTKGEKRTVNFTRNVSYEYDPKGEFSVAHSYVQYFIPEERNDLPPVVLVHGGGLTGSVWESTPDGRHGWLHLLLMRGFEVHVIDMVERGRSGFAPNLFKGQPVSRSLQEAWSLFRIGAAENFKQRTPFDNQKFPVDAFDQFTKSLVPRWFENSQYQVDALVSLLDKLGSSIIICHSQGGEIGLDAACKIPEAVASIIAIEPSGSPTDLSSLKLKEIPLTLVHGDYLDCDELWKVQQKVWHDLAAGNQSNRYLIDLPSELSAGNSHFPMLDNNNEDALDLILNMSGVSKA